MKTSIAVVMLALVAALAGNVGLAAEAGSPSAGEGLVLGPGSHMRCFAAFRTPLIGSGDSVKEHVGPQKAGVNAAALTPFPRDDWQGSDFDDSSWTRMAVPVRIEAKSGSEMSGKLRDDFGFVGRRYRFPCMALQCVRSRFDVPDPAAVKGLRASVSYRGGAVVYVNGKEIARGHLPEGELKPEALAESYPDEAFNANGKAIPYKREMLVKNADGLEKRVRKLEGIKIDAALLRKGVNVLAVELHRAPYDEKTWLANSRNHNYQANLWHTCGLVELTLRAGAGVSDNSGRPEGIQIWNASVTERITGLSHGDQVEALRPIELLGVPNGSFCAKVVASSAAEIQSVKATAGELKQVDGKGAIPASAISVLYPRFDVDGLLWGAANRLDGLHAGALDVVPVVQRHRDDRSDPGAVQPVWIKVNIPADAAPGEYRGVLSVTAGAEKAEVPVHLKVIDWKLPDPRDYAGHMGAWQSPESVALKYEVEPWSEKHWELMEKEWKLLGEMSNNLAVIHVIEKSNRGNERGMIRWVKDGKGGYTYDFLIMDRYLEMAGKHCRLDYVILWVNDIVNGGRWRYGDMADREAEGKVKLTGPQVTLLDPATGKLETLIGPRYDKEPEKAKEFMAPMCAELRKHLDKFGLSLEKEIILGLVGDDVPAKGCIDIYRELLPGAQWGAAGHYDRRGFKFHDVPVKYSCTVYHATCYAPGGERKYGWRPTEAGAICTRFPRSWRSYQSLSRHRHFAERWLVSNLNGFGNFGADFWAVRERPDGRNVSSTISARYPETHWGQRNLQTTVESIFVPAPDGPVRTIRSEMLRESIQEGEARIFIEKAILGGKLPADLAKKCQELLDERQWLIRTADQTLGSDYGWRWWEGDFFRLDLAGKLYSCAAEVQKALKK